MTKSKAQVLYDRIADGEFDSVLVDLGEAISDRFKAIQHEKANKVRGQLKENSRAIVKGMNANWKYNGTVVKIERINQQTADCIVIQSSAIKSGKPVRFPLSSLQPLRNVKASAPQQQVETKRKIVLKRGK